MKVNSIFELIGNTPHLKMNRLFSHSTSEVWVKLEKMNPGASIKDRIALAMVEDAEAKKLINQDSVIIEPTSGNTGIGLAMVCAIKGYKLILVMPETMSIERRKIMAAYGAEFVLTPKEKGIKGSIEKAQELLATTANSWMPSQFDNPANVKIHETMTAVEILKDFPQGIDVLIAGVGTGGHFSGCAKILKEKFPNLKVYAVEPKDSPVLSGGNPGPHAIQGIGTGFIPKNCHTNYIDEVIQITKDEAYEFARRAAKEEGLLCGISSGATLAAVSKKINEIPAGAKILTFNYDTGERYLSMEGLF